MTQSGKLKLAVYTVLVGEKETLNNPLQLIGAGTSSDLDIDFFCFTDNDKLTSPSWQFRQFDHPLLPAEKASRLPKAQPDRFFPDHQYSLYIDNTVVFKRLPCRADIEGALFRGFRHPWRNNPLDEADIVVKSGLDGADVVAAQVNFYARSRPLEAVGTLTAGTVLLRRHHDPAVRRFGELWWEQILLFSKRDQLCLDLCAREAGCPVAYFAGDKTSNDLFLWPVLPDGRRVLGSFDADRYAWTHRNDPVALRQPRRHFLAHGGDGDKFTKRVPWFSYVCDRTGSGLGDRVPPRRGVADVVGELLAKLGDNPGGILVAGVRSAEALAVEPEELVAAQAAILQYFRYGPRPDVVTALVDDQDVLDPVPFRGAAGKTAFRLVLVLGLPTRCHGNALAKFLPLLATGGQLLVEFGGSLAIQDVVHMHEAIGNSGALAIFHGRHITMEVAIPSSVFVLDTARA